ncbi:MAG: CspA family cold shock protein [Alphaproteobacteria bacterium]|nr:CspA family cold shock protein [Alphaproteobacteria bacterium]
MTIAPSPEDGAIRVTGTVKWFDPSKGFGFIVSKDVPGDVLLHRSVIEEFGCAAVLEGATVECDVIQKVKGLQARKLHRIDNSTAANGVPAPAKSRSRDIKLDDVEGPVFEAICKWFSRPKGYGFVVAVGGVEDVFCHMDLLRRHSVRELRQGQRVLVRATRTGKGLTATYIETLPEDSAAQRPIRMLAPADFDARP